MEGATVTMDTTAEPHEANMNGFHDNSGTAESAEVSSTSSSAGNSEPSALAAAQEGLSEKSSTSKPSELLSNSSCAVVNGSGPPKDKDIENTFTFPMSPVSNKIVDGVRKEPRAKMTMSPNKSSMATVGTNNIIIKTATARKTLGSSSGVEKRTPVKEPDKEKETEFPSSPSTAGREGDIPKETASGDTGAVHVVQQEPNEETVHVIGGKPADLCEKQSEKNSESERPKGDCMKEASKTSMNQVLKQQAVTADNCDAASRGGAPEVRSPPPVKLGIHRARKSCQPSRLSNFNQKQEMDNQFNSKKASPLPLANMTLRLDEIEKTLGIKTLSDIDAKTLDKLILEKARTPKKSGGAVQMQKNNPTPPNKAVLSSVSPYSTGPVKMVSILKKDHVLAIKCEVPSEDTKVPCDGEMDTEDQLDSSSSHSAAHSKGGQLVKKKRRKRRHGVYNLPGGRKKKKTRKDTKVTSELENISQDESYETVSEMSLLDVSQSNEGVTSTGHEAASPSRVAAPSPSGSDATPAQLTPSLSSKAKFTVLIRAKEQPSPVKLKRNSSGSRHKATIGSPVAKETKSPKTASIKVEPAPIPAPVLGGTGSCVPAQTIIPRKKKVPPGGYIRGPYKPRKPKVPPLPVLGSSCEARGKVSDIDASRSQMPRPVKSARGRSNTARKTITVGGPKAAVATTKALGVTKEDILCMDNISDVGNDADSTKNKKRRRKWAILAYNPKGRAKRKKKMMMLARVGRIQQILPNLIQNPSREQTTGTVVKGKPQRSVMDMFRELREKGGLGLGAPLPGSSGTAPSLPLDSTVSTATQVETASPTNLLINLKEPPLLDLPLLKKEEVTAENLEQIKATLNAEATNQSARRSKRKRKPADDDSQSVTGSSTAASLDDSEPESSHHFGKVKRRKIASDAQDTSDEKPDLLPMVTLSDRGHTEDTPSPPEISPQKPLQPYALHQSDSASISSGSSSLLSKFVNTPNGVTYPVTPPKTPESQGNTAALPSSERSVSQFLSPLAKERDYLPLCCCRIIGASFSLNHQVLYCQALDSIDGRVVGCCNKVTNAQLVRPAVKIPFMAICEVHRKRLKLHQCCPGCGHFCTQGKFYQCKKEGGTAIHHFHRQCQVFKDNKYYCPHCGEESSQYEVTLKLHEPRLSFFTKEAVKPGNDLPPRAKMGTASRPSASASEEKEAEEDEEGFSLVLEGSDKEITTAGLPLGPTRVELENAISMLNGEKPKKMRTGPKSLFHAVSQQDTERILFLLAEGLDPNFKDEDQVNQTAMHAVATTGDVCIAHLLIQAGANPQAVDDELRTPLMVAAEQGYVKLANYLIKAGAVVDVKAEDGMTCLHLAAQAGCVAMCKFLLHNGSIDINVKDDGGWTPLIWAAEHRYLSTVRFLLNAGADPNIRDNEENTALHWAAYAGSVDIAELFLNAGCDIETPNEHGDRALHIAARQDHYQCVVLFLARGADTEARNNENEAPIGCCVDQEGQVWMALRVNRQLKDFAVKRLQRPEKLLHRDISMGRESNPIPVVNNIDDENYPQDFHYVTENVETSPMMVNRVISSLQSCKCKDDCSSMFCVCSRNSVQCWYDKEGHLVKDFNQIEPPLIFECNKACKCWASCQNRVVQLGITCRLQVFRTKGRGWGVRTLLDIQQGTFICEYIGEHISDAEADAREDDSYLFDLDNKDTDTFCIDARRYANVARFINHLCEPNLIPVKVFVEHQDLRFPRICFFSSRDIKAGEELGFDYGEKFWIIKWKQFTCACSSPKCKYSSETIQLTIADYNRRQREEEAIDLEQP